MKRFIRLKKASFTVEAAFLVPAATVILLLLVGFIYFAHEKAWTLAASGEACFYAIQRKEGTETTEEMLYERIEQRKREDPLGVDPAAYAADIKKNEIVLKTSERILPEVFGEAFVAVNTLEVKSFYPVRVKRTQWLGESLAASLQ